jgi:hypothetical protein
MLMLAALVAAPPPDPASVHVAQPQPYELWDGRVRGTAPAAAPWWWCRASVTGASGRGRWPLRQGAPRRALGDGTVTVGGHAVVPMFGVPSGSIRALPKPRPDLTLNKRLSHSGGLVTPTSRSTAGHGAVAPPPTTRAPSSRRQHAEAADHARCLSDNKASWSTPSTGTRWYGSPYSDNAAANELLEQTGGSDADGAADMVELMKSLG